MAYRNRALLVVALTIFVDAFIFGIIVPVLPIYSEGLGFSSFQLGVIFSVYSVALLLLSIPIGIISDRYGKKRVMVAGMSGLAIATICFAFSTTFITLLTTRLLQGVAAAVTWVVGRAGGGYVPAPGAGWENGSGNGRQQLWVSHWPGGGWFSV